MAKVDTRETEGRPAAPVRTSSGTRVAAVRLTPIEPSVASQPVANDINEMPTMELDLEQIRAMALRCASDVGPGEHLLTSARVLGETSRPRLELVLSDDEALPAAADANWGEAELAPPRRSRALAFGVLLVMLAAAFAAFDVYGLLP